MLYGTMISAYPLHMHSKLLLQNLSTEGYLLGTCLRYNRLTPEALVDRLVYRHHHLLAIRIAEYLKVRTDKILIHWACAKVKKIKVIKIMSFNCAKLRYRLKLQRTTKMLFANLLWTNFQRTLDSRMLKSQRQHTTLVKRDWQPR